MSEFRSDQIKLLFGRGRDERISERSRIRPVRGAEFSGSGGLQINDDFLLRYVHFGALLAAGKPEADLTNFRTLRPVRGAEIIRFGPAPKMAPKPL